MTGLDTDNDSIIEIATVVTDAQLNVLAEGPEFAIHHPLETLEAMDEWNRNQHRRSGLWQRVLDSTTTLGQAEAQTVNFLAQWIPAGLSPMCGNSICQDRRFLHRQMPRLEKYFHYRNLDVSTVKELAAGRRACRRRRQEQQPHRVERCARLDRRTAPLPPVHGRAVGVAGCLNDATG